MSDVEGLKVHQMGMTKSEYVRAVEQVLEAHTTMAVSRLVAALANVPKKAERVTIEIFMDQDGEGFLDIRVVLDGPDWYVLQKAIASHADIFSTKMTENGLDPNLPLMCPGGESFSVHDALSDTAAAWIAKVWAMTGQQDFHLPVVAVTHDDYGTMTPLQLVS
jgi:hypothetical protein